VAAGLALGRLTGFRNLITYDMGGTSTDVCLIGDLEATLTTEQHIAGLPNRTPQIEINSIGAGGGSLAWIDAGGALRVGPRSAGADPGPACYGRGGTDATITDANLVLGRVPADRPLAGEVPLDLDLARRAVSRLVPRVPGVAGEAELADGIVRIAVARMVSAIKEISIGKGHDPRDFVLLAYGGAGPMHAALIADELEIPRVLVPTAPGNFSAFGSLISDLRHDHVRTRLVSTRQGDFAEVEAIFGELEAEARKTLAREGIGPDAVRLLRWLGMRYVGQSWELLVRWPDGAGSMEALEAAFNEAHERRYGHASGGATEIVNFRVTAVGVIAKPTLPRWPAGGRVEDARRGERAVYFDGSFGAVPVYVRDRLPPGGRFAGPAIVEEMGSTTVVPPRWSGEVGEHGEIVLSRSTI
jgi:N-methylhydantoinase A